MKKWTYYNEHDSFAAAWLRELIKDGYLPDGEVDERDIQLVAPTDVANFLHAHWFAGIGGWPYALALAGWGDRSVWTGSCPCQPFSAAGKRKGAADERHLWPVWFDLIRQCRPDVVFGEQVESAIGFGWLDGVRADLEGEGYALGAAVLGAHSVGAPHIRQRLWWVADAGRSGDRQRHGPAEDARSTGALGREARQQRLRLEPDTGGVAGRVADADGRLAGHGRLQPGGQHGQQPQDGGAGGRLGDADVEGLARQPLGLLGAGDQGHWSRAEWLACSDGKARRIEPGIFPLAHGVSNRVGLLRGAGNAIVPQVAAEFVKAYLDLRLERPE